MSKNEQIDDVLDGIKEKKQTKLDSLSHRLKDWLEANFQSGKWWTIEEVVDQFRDSEGNPYLKINHNPKIHDKCVELGYLVKKLNWRVGTQRFIPILKNRQGSIKLCESKEELEAYVKVEMKRIEKTYQYYNHLKGLAELDGTIPFINQANRVLENDELVPVEVYQKGERKNGEV